MLRKVGGVNLKPRCGTEIEVNKKSAGLSPESNWARKQNGPDEIPGRLLTAWIAKPLLNSCAS